MEFLYKRTYLKKVGKYPSAVQQQVLETELQIKEYFKTGRASYGLRIKKLGLATYEARVSLSLRVVFVKLPERIVFALVGDHEEVRNFLKS